jgi:hypothetical protein
MATQPASAQVYGHIGINIGPPAPRVERIPVAPGPGYVWRRGYWSWSGSRYVWLGGSYIRRPYSGAAWIPGHWVHGPNRGWFYRPGHWS